MIAPIYRRLRELGQRFQFSIDVRIDDRKLWSSNLKYLVITPDEVTFMGALDVEPAHGVCPPGLDVPETLIDFQSVPGGPSFTSYDLRSVLRGGRPVPLPIQK